MVPAVELAIKELRTCFDGCEFKITPDAEGGALVFIEDVPFGDEHPYNHSGSWFGFRLNFQIPYADVYPIYVRGDLSRKDGKPLGEATSPTPFEGRSAIQLSRRSNKRHADFDTSALKIQKVLRWLLTRP